MKNLNIEHMRAYANGALDGYNCGSDNNPYDREEKPEQAQAYKMGYDFGVTMYCQDNEMEV
jgi:hypothetical protein